MTKMQISAAAMAAGLMLSGAAFAQTLNDPAQLQREHDRAVAAHDPANDPYNPRSSNRLNRQQLDRAQALGNGPVYQTDSYGMPAQTNAPPVAYNNTTYNDNTAAGDTYNSDDMPMSDDTQTSVTVLAPPHSAPSSFGQPDTNPQSTGTPSVDTPYVTTQPAP